MTRFPGSSACAVIPRPPATSKQPTILTIDDDSDVSQAIRRCFHRYNVTVLQACHGMHGVWLATTKDPDLVITDLRMPQGRGQDVVEYLKAKPTTSQIPIIVLTGVCDEELEHRLWAMGVNAILRKPAPFEDLLATVGRFIQLEKKTDD